MVNTPARLVEAVSGWGLPSDGAVPPLKGEHCRLIAQVVRMLCGTSRATSAAQEAAAVVGAFQQAALAVEGMTTYGNSAQRHEAAYALRDAHKRGWRYLIDRNTGELVIRVSDLHEVARRHVGGSLQRGWLDGRLASIEFRRVVLDGHAVAGRDGRKGPHLRCHVYRGHVGGGEAVTT